MSVTPLTNISVDDAALALVLPNATDYLFSGQSDFTDLITEVKREVHGRIRDEYDYTETEMANIKDLDPEKNLYYIIIYLTLSHIFLSNGLEERAVHYRALADGRSTKHYYDSDDDDAYDEGEEQTFKQFTTFSR